MKHLKQIAALVVLITLFTTCDKFETVPLTKVKTIAANSEVVSATFTGRIIDLSGKGNDDYGFCFATHSNPTPSDEIFSLGKPSIGEFTANIVNLTAGQNYYVRAYCKDGDGYVYGDIVQFSTHDGIINISTTYAVVISATTARAGVSIVGDGGGAITARGACWSTNTNPTIGDSYNIDGSGLGDFFSSIINLLPNTTYYVRAYATNIAGTAYGNEIIITTFEDGIVIDIDENHYPTNTYNNVEWLLENIRVTKYNDGTPIPTNLNAAAWESTTNGAYTIYPHGIVDGIDSETDMLYAYGLLYNWYAVNDSRGLCPLGWRVPTHQEWTELTDHIATINSVNIGNQLKSCLQVNSPLGQDCNTTVHPRWDANANHWGTDDHRFYAFPAGYRNANGAYLSLGIQGYWWSSSPLGTSNAWYRSLINSSGDVNSFADSRQVGFSVRCVRE